MGCEECEKFQKTNKTAYVRWKNANIEVRACEKHLRELFELIKTEQSFDAIAGKIIFDGSGRDLLKKIRTNKMEDWCEW